MTKNLLGDGEDKLKTAFRGQGNFIGNHYAVWEHGLGQEDPNLYAYGALMRLAKNFLWSKGRINQKKQTAYEKFIEYLKKIQEKEEEKERTYLRLKLDKVKRMNLFPADYLGVVLDAISNGDFGAAYTLLTEKVNSLKEIEDELKKSRFKSIQKRNSFWNAQFSKYFKDYFRKLTDAKARSKDFNFTNFNFKIEDFINDFMVSVLQTNKSDIVQDSLSYIRESYTQNLINLFNSRGLTGSVIDSKTNITFDREMMFKLCNVNINTAGNDKTVFYLIDEVCKIIANGIGKGLSTEGELISRLAGEGAVSIGTGHIEREMQKTILKEARKYSPAVKVDVLLLELMSGNVDVQRLAEEAYSNWAENGWDNMQALIEKIKEAGEELNDIFSVEVNAKGYMSYMDLQVEGEGSFKNRLDNLEKMKGVFPEGGAAMNQLITFLVNTTAGTMVQHRGVELSNLLASIFAAWMWDNYDEIYKIEEQKTIKRIRMFYSGSHFYSASEIMKYGINRIEDFLKVDDPEGDHNFIRVTINPAEFDAEAEYQNLLKKYPITDLIKDEDEAGIQNQLALRWNAMRDKILEKGTIGVKIEQKNLEAALGNLKNYII